MSENMHQQSTVNSPRSSILSQFSQSMLEQRNTSDENMPPGIIMQHSQNTANGDEDNQFKKAVDGSKNNGLAFKSLMHESLAGSNFDVQNTSGNIDRSLAQEGQLTDSTNLRKGSLVDCEISCEEVQEDEDDIRRKINQKLIKNKNYFLHFVAKKNPYQRDSQYRVDNQISKDQNLNQQSQQEAMQFIDKRSRSETPNKMSASEVLFRAHQKLQQRQKESPQKLMEKHQQRQKKAEELRAQIESSKKKWYEKIRIRQQIARERWKELLAERKARLYDKLEQAEERRETEIQTLKNKAKQEIQKIDETNYIVKMTMNNMKLDLNLKMNETKERRNQIMEEHKKKQHDRHLKEEAAEKRRQELLKETENKFLTNQQKREQADQRRIKMLEEKKRAAQEQYKRLKVLQRKNDLGDRISDVMSFVSNSENIWEFLGTEREWHELGIHNQDEFIYELLSKDIFEIEKLKLKKDAELINRMIVIDEENDQVFARKEYLQLLRKKKSQENDFSTSSDEEEKDENEIFSSPDKKHQSPNPKYRSTIITSEYNKVQVELIDTNEILSDTSEKDSVAEETQAFQTEGENLKSDESQVFEQHVQQPAITDEIQNYILYSQRIRMSMKRNVLKKNLSEDLTWADFLKNESYHVSSSILPYFKNRRSMHSTPERKSEVHSESGSKEATMIEEQLVQQRNSDSSSMLSSSNSKKMIGSVKNGGNQVLMGNTIQNNSSSSNISEKSRISSVVYPSKKKKNPKNQNTAAQNHDSKVNAGSFNKQKSSIIGSNHSSTQSLQMQNTIMTQQETPREVALSNQNQRKSVQLEQDSARKRQNARMHSSSVQEPSSTGGIQNLSQLIGNINNNSSSIIASKDPQQVDKSQANENDAYEIQSNATSMSHTGSQMNQLITNSKPNLPITKMMPKKLTANASKMLFPITQQKLLFKRPGKEGQFGKCKLNVKVEDLLLQRASGVGVLGNGGSTATSGGGAFQQQASFSNEIQQIQNDIKQVQKEIQSNLSMNHLQQEAKESETQKKGSQQSTPLFTKRRESTDTNNSSSNPGNNNQSNLNTSNSIISQNQGINPDTQVQKEASQPQGTPTQQSKLYAIHQKFWEKFQQQVQSQQQQQHVQPTQLQFPIPQASEQSIQPTPNLAGAGTSQQQSISPFMITTRKKAIGSNMPSENSPSPKKDERKQQIQDKQDESLNSSKSLIETQINLPQQSMNEQGYKELIIKYLLTDNIQYLKTDDTQKTIFLEGEEANKLIDYMEQYELCIRYCRLCDLIIPDHSTNEGHTQTKSHKKTRDDLGIKENEDLQFSILSLQSVPGDIEKELLKEKEKALKRKVKRLKAQMNAQAVSHESASYCPGKDFTSTNKKRFQILCIDLEKQVIPIIKDYEALENTLKEIIKILDMRKQADLHLMRKLKYIPILIEICKRISVCHKNEFKHLGRALEFVIKIINIFCGLRENRNYMLQTNRMQALIELLNWCLNRPTQLFYGITFMPQLFHILTLHVKHRAPYECQEMKEMFIEYLISSQITMKIKSKFQIINGPLDLSEMMGQVPIFLLKSATFIDSLTNLISMDAKSRPVYEKSAKIAEHVLFVVQNTELFGIIPMITTILLTRNQPFKPSSSNQAIHAPQKLLPQTILSLSLTSIKIINNVYRMDYRFAQLIMSDFEIQEQLYHLFNYILYYAVETSDKQEDSKELLHETILLIGYFCLTNEKNQALLCKGENTLLQKLCNLPFTYFCDKKLKEILFPTLITASYKNDRSLAIMDQEMSIEMLVDFIELNLKEELPKIIEEEYDHQSMSSLGHSAVERKSHRSPSLSSTTSSQCSLQIDMANGNSPYLPLYMRFPKKMWKDAITFYSKVLY